jgi:hypothetical protein
MDQTVRPEDAIDLEQASNPSTSKWNVFGKVVPRSEIVFMVQVLLVYIVVIVSIVNLTIGGADVKLWITLLSSSIGYILPSPTLKLNKR